MIERPIHAGEMLLDKYRVEHVLGRGGMGYVLAVRHVELDELFAMKLLSRDALQNPASVARFMGEARAAARLKSEHVARVIDVGHLEDGSVYLIMEYLEGQDLGRVLRERGALPAEVAITYVLQACDAISEVHANGLIHRDLKPGNLFLTRRPNGKPCIKVLDFGISKHLESDEADLTLTGVMLGSPRYMSPEQMRRTRTVDARCDVWSMGVVLHKLLTNTLPFRGETVPEVISSVLFEEPQLLCTTRPDLPLALTALLTLALEKEPEQRFQSIDELAQALTLIRDEMADRSSDLAAASAGAAGSSQPGEDGARPTPLPRSSHHEPYTPAIPAPRSSRSRAGSASGLTAPRSARLPGAPPAGVVVGGDSARPVSQPTSIIARNRNVKPRAFPRPQDAMWAAPRVPLAEPAAPRDVPHAEVTHAEVTRTAASRTIEVPERHPRRAKSMLAAVAVLAFVAFASAWVVRAWSDPGPGAHHSMAASSSLGATGTFETTAVDLPEHGSVAPPGSSSLSHLDSALPSAPETATPIVLAAAVPTPAPAPTAAPLALPSKPPPVKAPKKPVPMATDIHNHR